MGSAHVEDDEQRKIKRWQVELTPTGTCIAHYDRDGQSWAVMMGLMADLAKIGELVTHKAVG